MSSISCENAIIYDSILATKANIKTVNTNSVHTNKLNSNHLTCNNISFSGINNINLNSSTINLGNSDSNIVFNGTVSILNNTNSSISDNKIIINHGGTDVSGTGIEFEENGTIKASLLLNSDGDLIMGSSNDIVNLINLNADTVNINSKLINTNSTLNDTLLLTAGPISGMDFNVNTLNKSNTYVKFLPTHNTNTWAYLRQIGGADKMALSLDFHENQDNARFFIRDASTSTSTSVLSVWGNQIGINTDTSTPPTNIGLTVNGSATLGNDKLNHKTTINGPLALNGTTAHIGESSGNQLSINGTFNIMNTANFLLGSSINLPSNIVQFYTPALSTAYDTKTTLYGTAIGYYSVFGSLFKLAWGKVAVQISGSTNPKFADFRLTLPSNYFTTSIIHRTASIQNSIVNDSTFNISIDNASTLLTIGFIIASNTTLPGVLEITYAVIGY
jgi:hypothetical protein